MTSSIIDRYWGDAILVAGAAAGVSAALFDYFQPNNGIGGSWGALLVVASSALVLAASVILAMFAQGTTSSVLIGGAILLGLIGTAAAAYFLESNLVIVLMAVALAGWLIRVGLAPNAAERALRSDRTPAR